MTGSDDLWGILASVGGIASALALLYLSAWMSRVSETVRRHEIERQRWLDSLSSSKTSANAQTHGEQRRAA